jgi:hypothetical protein
MMLRPTSLELSFLKPAYERFFVLYAEIIADDFWDLPAECRLFRIKEGFAVYSELLLYEPLAFELEKLEVTRPPMEAEIARGLLKTIRNLMLHFPLFDTWGAIRFRRSMINWARQGQSIDRFLTKQENAGAVKYRFWETDKKRMTYLVVDFPADYSRDGEVVLSEVLNERDGVRFAFFLMKRLLDTQIDEVGSYVG